MRMFFKREEQEVVDSQRDRKGGDNDEWGNEARPDDRLIQEDWEGERRCRHSFLRRQRRNGRKQ